MVRWTLNALALLGDKEDIDLIAEAISRHTEDPDILSAGVAALFAIEKASVVEAVMRKKGIGLAGAALLAGAQSSPGLLERVRLERVDVDVASDAELRLALVLVGLNKAPPNTFSLKHGNGEIVGALNKHHEKSVAQYSVWAISESDSLSLTDLRVPLTDIEGLADNVRGWIYRLIAEHEATATKHLEYIEAGSEDPDSVARQGLSSGLATTYFDGLEEITMEWLPRETDPRVEQSLVEHMAAAVDKCVAYKEPVLRAYREAGAQSLLRARIEAASRDTLIYRELKLIEFQTENTDLLFDVAERLGPKMVTQNFHGNVGAVTGSGDINLQTLQMLASTNLPEHLRPALAAATNVAAQLPAELSSRGQALVQEAISRPEKSTFARLLEFFKGAREAAETAAGAGAAVNSVVEQITSVMDLF